MADIIRSEETKGFFKLIESGTIPTIKPYTTEDITTFQTRKSNLLQKLQAVKPTLTTQPTFFITKNGFIGPNGMIKPLTYALQICFCVNEAGQLYLRILRIDKKNKDTFEYGTKFYTKWGLGSLVGCAREVTESTSVDSTQTVDGQHQSFIANLQTPDIFETGGWILSTRDILNFLTSTETNIQDILGVKISFGAGENLPENKLYVFFELVNILGATIKTYSTPISAAPAGEETACPPVLICPSHPS
jgi:hypothetical protein